MKALSLLLILFVISVYSNTLNYYAVGRLSTNSIKKNITDRFKAHGEPLFLIHDSKRGIAVGDFIKFQDKIVLINSQVWQTLAKENALKDVKKIAITTLKGGDNSSEWYAKSKRVKSDYSKKSYILGAEILKIFEKQFSYPPNNDDIILSFKNGRVTLIVPNRLINNLTLQRVAKSIKSGKMEWVTSDTIRMYKGYETNFQVWAVDPAEPSGSIKYSIAGGLPNGVEWDNVKHTFTGIPVDTGTYTISVTAKSVKQRAEQNIVIKVVALQPPIWANSIDTFKVAEQNKVFLLNFVDDEFAARKLSVSVNSLPKGFSINETGKKIDWIYDSTNIKFIKNMKISFTVTNPLGKQSSYSVPVYYEPDGVDVGYTFATLTPPWDTLVQGVTYKWNIKREKIHWRKNHLQMNLGKSSNITELQDSIVEMIPQKGDSLFTVQFLFKDRDKEVSSYTMTLPVIKNRPPYFEAFPDKWDIEKGDFVYFTPKAKDPEGEKVSLKLRSADSGFVYDSSGVLSFEADQPGTYQAYLEATDEFGNTSVQQVSYYVKKVYDRYRGFHVKTGVWPGGSSWSKDSWGFMQPWELAWETPALRFGIFTSDDMNMFSDEPFRMPFVYIGTDFVPPAKRANGSSVAADLGFSYNVVTHDIHTLGLYLNLEATAVSKKLFNSVLDFRFQFFARHLLRKISVNYTINEEDNSLTYNSVKSIELLEEFIDPNNLNLFVNATEWFHIVEGLFVGPTIMTRIAPVAAEYSIDTVYNIPDEPMSGLDTIIVKVDDSKNIYTSMVGVGVRYNLKVSNFDLDNKIRMGYGGRDYGFMVYWDIIIGTGRFKR